MTNETPSRVVVEREHEICCGHRVYGHEGKCRNLHGHGYVFRFTVTADSLDRLGRILDFSVVKSLLCEWLERSWDHRTLLWEADPLAEQLCGTCLNPESIVVVPFNPTAENMALYLLNEIGPEVLKGTGVKLQAVRVHETRKCSATASC